MKESFEEKLKNEFIPTLEEMIKKESEHLQKLIDCHVPDSMIQKSKNRLNHYKKRLKEYLDFKEKK